MLKTLKKTAFRPAIAMIELIFAIVIIGISLLSAPLIIGQSVQSINTNLQQESIAAAASQISLILTYPWDEGTTSNVAGNGILRVVAGAPVLSVASRDTNFTRQYNALASGFEDASTLLGFDPDDIGSMDDIDDFNGQSYTLTLYSSEDVSISDNEGDYIDNTIIMRNQVVYGADVTSDYTTQPVRLNNPFRQSNDSTDIKIITVNLTSASGVSEHGKQINLSAFTCNIGGSNLIPTVNMRILP